jgi:hypothetical protein
MVPTTNAQHVIRKRVVILGGGTAGALIALQLQRDANITLVDERGYFRAMLVPSQRTAKAVQRSSAMLSNVRHVQGKVCGLDERHVLVKRDAACPLHHQIVGYDTLVFALDADVADARSDAPGGSAGALTARCMASPLRGGFAAALVEAGELAIDDHARVVGFPRWFAVGGLAKTMPNRALASQTDIDNVTRGIKALLLPQSGNYQRLTASASGAEPAMSRDEG